jgi:hypothetical protein
MTRAQLLRSGRPPKQVNITLGDIVLNQRAVQAVWEVGVQADANQFSELEQPQSVPGTDELDRL